MTVTQQADRDSFVRMCAEAPRRILVMRLAGVTVRGRSQMICWSVRAQVLFVLAVCVPVALAAAGYVRRPS